MSNNFKLAFLVIFFISACSSERNTFTNRAFHNLTSHFNAYYLAEVNIQEIEKSIIANYKEDYSQILPVFIPIDSTTINQNEEVLVNTRELASKAIEWHRISRWVDDSYYLLGKVDYLEGNFDEAQNTFKYVNVNAKDKDLRHKNLITLLRLYVDLKEFDKANFTIDYLSKETEITDENRYTLYQTLAYYYESRNDKNGVLVALDKALEYGQDKKESSRINFILAQRYQMEGLDAIAYEFYKKSLEGNPPYERSFFAQLYAQQVAELNASKDLKKVRKYYEDLYKDPKNKDLKDVVVFEMALFEEKQGDLDKSLDLLHQAAKEPGSNPRTKGYIYQKLATLNLEELKDYRATKYYLDSALSYIKTEDPVAIQITEQKETLDQYVFHVERIEKNDSLIALSLMTPEEQKLVAEAYIKSEENRLLAEAAAAEQPKNTSIFDNLLAFNDRGSGSTFYFDNGLAMQQGAIEFRRNWGNRPLEDNWRRSSVSFQNTNSTIAEPAENDSTTVEEDNPLNQLPDLETLLSGIPDSPEKISELELELDESYFELGKLLYFELEEIEQSIENLEILVSEFPSSSRKPEAYYLLYLSQKDLNGNSEKYVSLLNNEYPNSPFTFSVNNPNAASGNLAYLKSSEEYEKAYNAYYDGQYYETKEIIKAALKAYPITRNTDRLVLLDIMASGKTESRSKYRERLEAYIENTSDVELVDLARNMLKPMFSSEELRALADSIGSEKDSTLIDPKGLAEEEEKLALSESPYIINNSQTHIFVLVLKPTPGDENDGLLGDLENFHAKNFSNGRLRTGNMNLNRENPIYIISPFSNAEKAKEYYDKFLKDFSSDGISEEIKKDSFFISIENFQQLNKTKNIEEYRSFFKTAY